MKHVPPGLLGLFFLYLFALAGTGILDFAGFKPFLPHRSEPRESIAVEKTEALRVKASEHISTSKHQLHRVLSHFSVPGSLLTLLLATWLALFRAWKGMRRKALACICSGVLSLLVIFVVVLSSFTGFMVSSERLLEHGPLPDGPFLRFAVLHCLGFPMLLAAVSSLLAIVFWRLWKRTDHPATTLRENGVPAPPMRR